ncbi:hypothetical protein E2562_030552 [Oryza meyeriana var. granulata]|uniref:Uncharacterized protein n=1 Tax=Oryza meyeriana var. granulata TaxID=110450 RepID=A0A6G1DB99_9ORYZ|nr:hypothetical protein E2562_030552 [Oryza meyeriana var. granulata]
MASVGFGTTVAPAVTSPAAAATAGRRLSLPSARVGRPSATKSVTAAAATEEKGLFDTIFGALYKEEQLLETDPILNKVEGKAAAAPDAASRTTKAGGTPAKKSSGDGDGYGGFSIGGFFSKKE